METVTNSSPTRWRKRLLQLSIAFTLMGISFAVGVAITVLIAVRVLAPIAVTGMTIGMVGLASVSGHASTSALYSGDSEMRREVLTQLKEAFVTQPSQTIDDTTANWLLPAIEQCQMDNDPEVVALADELIEYINANTLPPSQ